MEDENETAKYDEVDDFGNNQDAETINNIALPGSLPCATNVNENPNEADNPQLEPQIEKKEPSNAVIH